MTIPLLMAPFSSPVQPKEIVQTPTTLELDVFQIAPKASEKPNYTERVLKPLYAAQAAAAAEAARIKGLKEACEATGGTFNKDESCTPPPPPPAPVVQPSVASSAPAYVPSGSHEDWMAAAGIAASDYFYASYIIDKESGWRVGVANNEGSGAYGLGQALPAGKMAPWGADYLTNPVTQLRWAQSYAVGRYGSWNGAYSYWLAHHNW